MNYVLDPAASTLEVWTYKEGLLSRVAHDLCLRATDWSAELQLEEERFTVRVDVAAAGLRVQGQVQRGAVTPLKASDHRDIEANMRGKKVLAADVHPRVVYVAEGGAAPRGEPFMAAGKLTLRGRTRDLPARVTIRDVEGGVVEVTGEVELLQSSFGIKPYSAMLGALKIKDTVRITFSLRCRPG
jgi:polyisoprenoid-binding protein YceI